MIEAAARLWPVCIHLAETTAERELLETHDGPFVPFLRDLGVWDPSGWLLPGNGFVEGLAGPSALFAHGNYLPPDTRLPPNATVVFCPRTHAAFGHPPHPFRELMGQGVRIALGTDSLASNPDLDVLAEARFIREHYPDVPGDQVLRMATMNGAEALGFGRVDREPGAGKSADLVVVPLPDREDRPFELLLSNDPGPLDLAEYCGAGTLAPRLSSCLPWTIFLSPRNPSG